MSGAGLATLLTQAVGLHQKGQLIQAQALYRQVLDLDPHQFDALHLLGVIARQQDDPARAVDLIGRAIAIDPRQAKAHCNLGAALQDLGRSQDALASYERAIERDPRYALALSNRGNALRHLGRLDDALASYERALAIQPVYPEAWCNRAIALNDLGRAADALSSAERAIAARPNYADAWHARANALALLDRLDEALHGYDRALALKADGGELQCSRGSALHRLGKYDDALGAYDRAIAARPAHPLAWQYRANSLRALGRIDEAAHAYRQALVLGGDAAQIEFALAALGQAEAPAASPPAYVKALFDQYAGHFDEHLVERLGYQTPAILGAALARWAIKDADALDLGCGTGLFAPMLRACSRTLTGVDLSENMLEKARERGLYDRLVCADIIDHLAPLDEDCDLIAAADVFVYFGDLDPLFGAIARALRPGGHLCFSIEAAEGEGEGGYTLGASNRYAHAPGYIDQLAARHGFTQASSERHTLRRDHGRDVHGYAIVLRKS